MKKEFHAFRQFIRDIKSDVLLTTIIITPIIIGVFFRFVVPIIEINLCLYFTKTHILSSYYLMFDLLLALLTPLMFSFCGVMVILGEIDDKISCYMAVTPLGKSGYLLSRIGIPTIIAIFYNMMILTIFSLTKISFVMVLSLSILCAMMGIITSLLVVSIASNKVEGMALTKLSGLLFVGMPIAFFVSTPIQYLAGILPSFWLTKLSITQNFLFFIPTLIFSLLWIFCLYGKFEKKLL